MTETTAPVSGHGTTTETSGAAAIAPPAAPAAPAAWYSGFDQDTLGWMENRGLTKLDEKAALQEAVKGHRNAEKYMGVPADKLLRLPDFEKADKVEMDQFFTKLGRPATPAEYKLAVPEGASNDFADWAKNVFHEHGLTAKQAESIANKWNEYVGGIAGSQQQAAQERLAQQQQALKNEWGEAYERNDFYAGEAIRKLGWDQDKLKALTSAVGFDTAMKMFADLGSKVGEDNYVQGARPATGPLTPAQAKSRIQQLTSDKEFAGKLMAGNADAKAEWDRLHMMLVAGNG